jgi:hypothetical protein
MENWLLKQAFYHELTTTTHETMDVATGGAFLSLNLRDATTLVEKMAILSLAREKVECINSRR